MKNKCVRPLTAAVVLLMVIMVLSLSGCGKKNDVENGTGQTDTTTDTDAAENTADTPDDADKAASKNSDSSASAEFSFADLQLLQIAKEPSAAYSSATLTLAGNRVTF